MANLPLRYYGTKASILDAPYAEGAVYVTTDTQEVFLDLNNQRLQLTKEKDIIVSEEEPETPVPLWIQTL